MTPAAVALFPAPPPGAGSCLDTKGIYRTDAELRAHEAETTGPDDRLLSLQWDGDQGTERKRMCAALRGSGDHKTADRLAGCSSRFSTFATREGVARVSPHRCDLSVCPRCIGHRTRETRRRYTHHAARTQETRRPSRVLTSKRWASPGEYRELVEAGAVAPFPGDDLPRETGRPVLLRAGTTVSERGMVRMMTLTQPVRADETWKHARTRLLRQWARFWRSKRTRARVDGGMRRVETTWSLRCRGWHVHIHFAYEGDRWDTDDLIAEWSAAGEGSNVDIRKVTEPEELFKYLLKTAKAPAPRLVEYAHESRRVRNLEMMGTWREPVPPAEEKEGPDFFPVDAGAIRGAAEHGHVEPWRLVQWARLLGSETDALQWARAVWRSRTAAICRREDHETERMQKEIDRRARRLPRRWKVREGPAPAPVSIDRSSFPALASQNE